MTLLSVRSLMLLSHSKINVSITDSENVIPKVAVTLSQIKCCNFAVQAKEQLSLHTFL